MISMKCSSYDTKRGKLCQVCIFLKNTIRQQCVSSCSSTHPTNAPSYREPGLGCAGQQLWIQTEHVSTSGFFVQVQVRDTPSNSNEIRNGTKRPLLEQAGVGSLSNWPLVSINTVALCHCQSTVGTLHPQGNATLETSSPTSAGKSRHLNTQSLPKSSSQTSCPHQ